MTASSVQRHGGADEQQSEDVEALLEAFAEMELGQLGEAVLGRLPAASSPEVRRLLDDGGAGARWGLR